MNETLGCDGTWKEDNIYYGSAIEFYVLLNSHDSGEVKLHEGTSIASRVSSRGSGTFLEAVSKSKQPRFHA